MVRNGHINWLKNGSKYVNQYIMKLGKQLKNRPNSTQAARHTFVETWNTGPDPPNSPITQGKGRRGPSMIESNAATGESSIARGREFLQRGDVSAAVECYEHAYDPDALDEAEARNMLIEARSHLLKKFLPEALESFEEALLMGTEVQRRQALEGILAIGEIRSRLAHLAAELKKGLKSIFGKKSPASKGLALVSDEENLVLISSEALNSLPVRLAAGKRVVKLPQRLTDHPLPFATDRCILYTDDEDVDYILEVAEALVHARVL